jgi:site-specific recombinase XerC
MPNLLSLRVESRALPAIVAAADQDARQRFLEFFASNIRNPHTRRAYLTAVEDFLDWCEGAGVASFREVRPLHVAAWVKQQSQTHKAPTAKLRLAALRHLFDWLVNGQVVPINPAASVRGPTHVVRKGQTPMLEPKEARKLLDSIDTGTPIGLRDRALLALMVYPFARVGGCLCGRHR